MKTFEHRKTECLCTDTVKGKLGYIQPQLLRKAYKLLQGGIKQWIEPFKNGVVVYKSNLYNSTVTVSYCKDAQHISGEDVWGLILLDKEDFDSLKESVQTRLGKVIRVTFKPVV